MFSGSALSPLGHNDHFGRVSNLGIPFCLFTVSVFFIIFYSNFSAESLYYPVSDKKDLLEFLHEIDGPALSRRAYQPNGVSGLGRITFDRVWTPWIEGIMFYDSMSLFQ